MERNPKVNTLQRAVLFSQHAGLALLRRRTVPAQLLAFIASEAFLRAPERQVSRTERKGEFLHSSDKTNGI